MFKLRNRVQPQDQPDSHHRQSSKPAPIGSLVGEGVVVDGDITLPHGLKVVGSVNGNIAISEDRGVVLVHAKGDVAGDVLASIVHIAGHVRGTIRAKEVHLYKTAIVDGDIGYERLVVQDGATLNGRAQRHAQIPLLEELPEQADEQENNMVLEAEPS